MKIVAAGIVILPPGRRLPNWHALNPLCSSLKDPQFLLVGLLLWPSVILRSVAGAFVTVHADGSAAADRSHDRLVQRCVTVLLCNIWSVPEDEINHTILEVGPLFVTGRA